MKLTMTDELREAIRYYAKVMKTTEAEAQADAESMIAADLKDNPTWTEDFAVASWIEDTMDLSVEELDAAEKEMHANMAKLIHAHSTTITDAFGNKRERVRKPNEDKRNLIDLISKALALASIENDVSNIERQVDFKYGGTQYSITLTAHRPPKEAK